MSVRNGLAWLRATNRRVWWTSFVLLLGLALVWTFTTPPLGSGDETSHVVRAHALADGSLIGKPIPGGQEQNRYVEVPAIYTYVGRANLCFAYNPRVPASCSRFSGPQREVDTSTVTARYPPLYYAAIGIGSKWLDPLARVDIMRVVSALMCAALLASAIASLRRLRRAALAATGLAIAITPTALYMFGIVNPSAFETAAGIALWVSGTLLVWPRDEPSESDDDAVEARAGAVDGAATRTGVSTDVATDVTTDVTTDVATGTASRFDPRLITRTGVAATALVLSRPASPFWLLLIALSFVVLSSRATVRALLADHRARVWAAIVFVATLAQSAWILIVKPLEQQFPQFGIQGGFGNSVQAAIGETYPNYVETIGSLGFMNEPVPTGVIVLWTAGIAALVVLAWLLCRRAVAWVVGALIVVLLVVPTAIQAIQAAETGLYWQGRFVLPLAVGIPIVAAIGLARRRPVPGSGGTDALHRLIPLLAGVFVIGQVVSYAQQLRRWTVGSRGTLMFFVDWDWSRTAPPWFLLAGFVVLIVAFAAWLFVPDRARVPAPVAA